MTDPIVIDNLTELVVTLLGLIIHGIIAALQSTATELASNTYTFADAILPNDPMLSALVGALLTVAILWHLNSSPNELATRVVRKTATAVHRYSGKLARTKSSETSIRPADD